MSVTKSRLCLAASAIVLSLALSGCNPRQQSQVANEQQAAALPALPATLPMTTGAATQPAYARSAQALPAAPRIRAVRVADNRDGEGYAYADDAYSYANAIGDAPPDYGFGYDGVEPWAWQGYDGSLSYAEPIDRGYRYYYYRPGADEPYYVQDPDYGYGYDNGQLAAIYTAAGALLPYADYGPRYDYAGRYLYRGRELYRASRTDRRAVIAANWADRRAAIDQERARWAGLRDRQADWQRYHDRYADQRARYWQPEDWRRQADARRFAEWHRSDFRAPPPPRAIPVAWQRADWARDEQRYRPAEAAIQARAENPDHDHGPVAGPAGPSPRGYFHPGARDAGPDAGPGDRRPGAGRPGDGARIAERPGDPGSPRGGPGGLAVRDAGQHGADGGPRRDDRGPAGRADAGPAPAARQPDVHRGPGGPDGHAGPDRAGPARDAHAAPAERSGDDRHGPGGAPSAGHPGGGQPSPVTSNRGGPDGGAAGPHGGRPDGGERPGGGGGGHPGGGEGHPGGADRPAGAPGGGGGRPAGAGEGGHLGGHPPG